MSTTASRTANSARNAGVSILAQILIIVLGFITRTVFVKELGVALLGVNSLLTSVVSMLALADLGINGAVMYALYKPIREGDTDKTAAIVRYATRMYRWVAVLVAVVGLGVAPFLNHLVRLDEDVPMLEIYYLVLLANTVVGYLMLARLQLIDADQKMYLTKAYSMAFNVLRSVAQIASLIVLESFLVFLVIQVVFTFANNLVVYRRAGQLYPFLKESPKYLNATDRSSILTSVRGMMIFRLGGLVLNNSPAVLISTIVGTMALGYYSNYMLIVTSVMMISEVIFASLVASVGNLVASDDRQAARSVFDEIVLLAIIIFGTLSVGISMLASDFIALWLGVDYVLPHATVIGIVLNFYVTGVLLPIWSYRIATGMFRQTQYVMLITAIVSIALSLVLGNIIGLAAIVIAPGLARLFTGAWYEPWILVRDHLSGRVLPYFLMHVGAFALWAGIAVAVAALGAVVPGNTLTTFAVKAGLCVVLLPIGAWAAFHRTDAFSRLIGRVRTLLASIRSKP